jgi:GT2 family glycosyltransferase
MSLSKNDPKISIVILNWNGKKDTIECLSSLENLNYSNYDIVVVDNGSTDDSIEVIKSNFPNIILIENKKNLGFAEGNNVGVDFALKNGADYLFLLNNDTIVDKDILSEYVNAMNAQKNAGILGAKILRYDKRDIIDHLGGKWNGKKAEFESFANGEKDSDQYDDMKLVDYVCGCAIFVKREVFETIGNLEPRFFLIWEESDFCYRAKKANFEIWTAPKAKLYHKISQSFTGGKPQMQYYWWRNRLFWIERNLNTKDKLSIYFKTIFPEIVHLFKLFFLKTCQKYLHNLFSPKKNNEKRSTKLLRYKAGCKGVMDYVLRNFYQGPSFLTKKKN